MLVATLWLAAAANICFGLVPELPLTLSGDAAADAVGSSAMSAETTILLSLCCRWPVRGRYRIGRSAQRQPARNRDAGDRRQPRIDGLEPAADGPAPASGPV